MQSESDASEPICPSCGHTHVGDGFFCQWCGQFLMGPDGVMVANLGRRFVALLLDGILVYLTLFIGYLIWWLIVLARGQTPGKQLMGIKVIKDNGQPSGWGYTFMREFLVKGLLFGVLSIITLYIAWLLNLLWPLWDRNRQALHDKVAGTLVVRVQT